MIKRELILVGILSLTLVGCAQKTTAPTTAETNEAKETVGQANSSQDEVKAEKVVEDFLNLAQQATKPDGDPLKMSAAVAVALTSGARRSVQATPELVNNVKGFAQIPDDPNWSFQVTEVQMSEDGESAAVNVNYTSSSGTTQVAFTVGQEDGAWKIDSTN